jgi:hypothetical protein
MSKDEFFPEINTWVSFFFQIDLSREEEIIEHMSFKNRARRGKYAELEL